jgi:nitroreductase
MDTLEAIFTRKSVRRYQDKEVPDDIIEKITHAGMSAPSAGNAQPWHFIIVTDKKTLKTIPEVSKNSEMAKDAPLAILVCGDQKLEKARDYWVQDCSAASMNMLLAAHTLGLGAVWTGVYPMEDVMAGMKILLDLPDNIIPFSLIIIGYPADDHHKDRMKEERVHKNGW